MTLPNPPSPRPLSPRTRDVPALPCPECLVRGVTGKARIGNYRSECTTCNNFARNVRRVTTNLLKERHIKEFESIRVRVEADLYRQLIEEWSDR